MVPHLCQLSRIILEFPGYGTLLPVSRMGLQISRIKTTLNLLKTLYHCRLKSHPKLNEFRFSQTSFIIS